MFFRYILPSMLARKGSNAITVLSIAAVIGACMVMIVFVNGLTDLMTLTGSPTDVVVLSQGAQTQNTSFITKDQLDQLKVLRGVAKDGDTALVSPEFLDTVLIDTAQGGYLPLVLRGVDPIAMKVHRQVKIIAGRAPAEHAPELLVGRQLIGQYPGVEVGGSLTVGPGKWPIVGVFSDGGSALESEVWTDRGRLSTELKKPNRVGTAILVAESPGEVPALLEAIGGRPALRLSAMRESDYYLSSVGNLPKVIRSVSFIILVLVFGATFAATNSLHTSFLGRLPEFATLNVLGFRRGKLSFMLLEESLFLALLGTAVGCGLAYVIRVNVSGLGYSTTAAVSGQVTPIALGEGAAIGFAIGLLGGLVPAVLVRRFDVLRTLT